ncbi:MAG TPA: TRAP transporter substrate-binding protein DctP [Myxococcota bacterium]|jgi:TRAP-type C4-dicarboxylate transport system substrate-binding protein|nr:TRAP transporter substrate-binding protein DctP [Myxococcota bacterium]
MPRPQKNLSAAVAALALGAAVLALAGSALAARELKMATLAPKKSTWYTSFAAISADLEKATGGALKLKIYPGGIHGDEKPTVSKIKTGLLDIAAVTAVGLSAIEPDVIAFELPMLFKSYKELDYVRDALRGELDARFEAKGYKILGWGDIGYLYVFSNAEVHTPAELKKIRLWAWTEDPISKTIGDLAGASTVPLAVPDVLPSLNTGVVDAFVSSPYATIALGWASKVKFMAGSPVAIGIGATVLSKAVYDSLPPDQQKLLMDVGAKRSVELVAAIRNDNKKAIDTLRTTGGISVYALTDAEKAEWAALSDKVAAALTGKVISAPFLAKVKAKIAEARKK